MGAIIGRLTQSGKARSMASTMGGCDDEASHPQFCVRGSCRGRTSALLTDLLRAQGVKATFFAGGPSAPRCMRFPYGSLQRGLAPGGGRQGHLRHSMGRGHRRSRSAPLGQGDRGDHPRQGASRRDRRRPRQWPRPAHRRSVWRLPFRSSRRRAIGFVTVSELLAAGKPVIADNCYLEPARHEACAWRARQPAQEP